MNRDLHDFIQRATMILFFVGITILVTGCCYMLWHLDFIPILAARLGVVAILTIMCIIIAVLTSDR